MTLVEINQIITYIENHITEDLSLNDIARAINYSPYYCSTNFRLFTGTSIKRYIHKRRLYLAAQDLKETSNRIIDIAYEYSYQSQEAFSRAFSNCFGMSPLAFRKDNKPVGHYHELHQVEVIEEVYMKGEVVQHLQEKIAKAYPTDVLHLLNGGCMLEEFKTKKWMFEAATYLPFNEAMCWGRAEAEVFSEAFITQRAKALDSPLEKYEEIVCQTLRPLFDQKFDVIVLWFGDDMFCQINLLTVLAYLDQNNYKGDVLFCMADEVKDEMLPDALAIDIEGWSDVYEQVVCKQTMPKLIKLPVMYQGIKHYLNYRNDDGEINRYIKKHIDKDKQNLILELFKTFPYYGLGDLQYNNMIDLIKNK